MRCNENTDLNPRIHQNGFRNVAKVLKRSNTDTVGTIDIGIITTGTGIITEGTGLPERLADFYSSVDPDRIAPSRPESHA